MMKIVTSIKKFFYSLFAFTVVSVPAWAEEEFTRQCPTLLTYMNDGKGSNFILRPFFEIVRDVCSDVARASWTNFAPGLQGVVAIGLAIYIAVYTLRNIGSFSQQDVSAYLSGGKGGVIPLAVKAAFIIALLANQSFVYEYLIAPIIQAGHEIGHPEGFASFSTSNNISSLFNNVITTAKGFNDKIYKIIAIGRLMLCLSFLPKQLLDWYWIMIPFGATLYVFGWLILISVSFYLLDIMFKLAVGCILLPMGIACGMSKITSGYTKKLWELFINVAFNFVVLGVVIRFVTKLIESIVAKVTADATLAMILEETKILNKADADALAENLSAKAYILLTLACLVAFKLFMSVEQIADDLAGGAIKGGLAQKLGGEAVKRGKQAVSSAARGVKGIAKSSAKTTGDSISNSKFLNSGWIGSVRRRFRRS